MEIIGRVILTGSDGRVGEIARRSLEVHGLNVSVFEGPDAHRDTPGFLRELHKYIAACRAEAGGAGPEPIVLLPVFFPEVLAEHRDEFPECIIPLDTAEKIRLLDNKLSACLLAERLGIPQPRRYAFADGVLTDMGDGSALPPEFPVVFKRTSGQGGDSVYFPRDGRALANLAATAGEYLITEFIEGENWCTDCLRIGGTFRAASYRVLEPKGKGVSTRRGAVLAPQMEAYCRRMLEAIDYQGVCGMDFRRGDDGRFFFLECNPRFSGGLETTLESGFDIVWDYLRTSLAVR